MKNIVIQKKSTIRTRGSLPDLKTQKGGNFQSKGDKPKETMVRRQRDPNKESVYFYT